MPEEQSQTQETTTTTEEAAPDLSTLFTPEEVTAKQEAVAASAAEETRRSALTEEERVAEDTAKAAETAAAEEAAKNNKAPEEYADFKMPEGMPVDEALLNDFKPLAKELDLPQEKAQKLIDLYAEKVAPLMQQRQVDAWNETRKGWVETAKLDKEIGGDKFDPALADAMRVVNTLGTPELKQVFNDYGIGDNPEVVRVFARMAKYLKEDTPPGGNADTGLKGSTAKDIYPYMNP